MCGVLVGIANAGERRTSITPDQTRSGRESSSRGATQSTHGDGLASNQSLAELGTFSALGRRADREGGGREGNATPLAASLHAAVLGPHDGHPGARVVLHLRAEDAPVRPVQFDDVLEVGDLREVHGVGAG